MNVSDAKLEGAFARGTGPLQPTAGLHAAVKDRILHIWEQRPAEAKERAAEQEKRAKV